MITERRLGVNRVWEHEGSHWKVLDSTTCHATSSDRVPSDNKELLIIPFFFPSHLRWLAAGHLQRRTCTHALSPVWLNIDLYYGGFTFSNVFSSSRFNWSQLGFINFLCSCAKVTRFPLELYTLSLAFSPPQTVVMLVFREEKTPEDEIKAWQFWHSRQHSVKQRILDVGRSRFWWSFFIFLSPVV